MDGNPEWTRRGLLTAAGVAGLSLVGCSDGSARARSTPDAATAVSSTPIEPGGVRTVMIVRHAEKPAGSVHGVTPDGSKDDESLTTVGWARAGALAGLFAPERTALREGLLRPRTLIASNPSGHGSKRPLQTITPLAGKLALRVDASHSKSDVTGAARTAAGSAGPTLVSWQHELIPALARALGTITPAVPATWPGSRYDMVWVFRTTNGTHWTFTQVPQLVLAGDSAQPIIT